MEAALWRHWALAGLGRIEEALAYHGDPPPPERKPAIAYVYGAGGNTAEAVRLIEEAEQELDPSTELNFAWAYASVGRFDEAFEVLDAAYERRDPFIAGIRSTDNRWHAMRSDPRYAALLERMNFPP